MGWVFCKRTAFTSEQSFGELIVGYDAGMTTEIERPRRPLLFWRAVVEVTFILFLFYANLLMGEFTRSNSGKKTLLFALRDIFTATNFGIALISALIGYVVFEQLRKMI